MSGLPGIAVRFKMEYVYDLDRSQCPIPMEYAVSFGRQVKALFEDKRAMRTHRLPAVSSLSRPSSWHPRVLTSPAAASPMHPPRCCAQKE